MSRIIKILIVVAVAVAVVAGIVVYINAGHDDTYAGSNDTDSYSLTINGGSFTLNEVKKDATSQHVIRESYKGDYSGGVFTVREHSVKETENGKTISDRIEKDLNYNLADNCRVRVFSDSFLIDGIYLVREKTEVSERMVDVSSKYNYDKGGNIVRIGKDSSKTDFIDRIGGVIEYYSTSQTIQYEITGLSDIDLTALGEKTVTVSYGDGKSFDLSVEVVDFDCTVTVMPVGITYSDAVDKGYIVITPSDAKVSPRVWDSSAGTRDVQLSYYDDAQVKTYSMTFKSDEQKEVESYETTLSKYLLRGNALPEFTMTFYLKDGTVYKDVPSSDLTISGYDKDTWGYQELSFEYKRSVAKMEVFVYDSEHLIYTSARLVDSYNYNPPESTLLIDYDSSGLLYDHYRIELTKCDGSTVNKSLMDVNISNIELIDFDNRKPVQSTLSKEYSVTLEGTVFTYSYSQKVALIPYNINGTIVSSLSMAHILSHSDIAEVDTIYPDRVLYTTMKLDANHGIEWTTDTGSTSRYCSNDIQYTITGDRQEFIMYLGSEKYDFNLTGTVLEGATIVGCTVEGDYYFATYTNPVTKDNVEKYQAFGAQIGDTIKFYVTYDRVKNLSDGVEINIIRDSVESHVCDVVCTYDDPNVHYSEGIRKYIEHDTIDFKVKYQDGSELILRIVSPTKYITFICDSGHGLYKDQNGVYEYEIPAGGITGSVLVYYI